MEVLVKKRWEWGSMENVEDNKRCSDGIIEFSCELFLLFEMFLSC